MDTRLEYYLQHSPITDPGPFTGLLDPLPDHIPTLVEIIQGLLLHRLAAEHIGVTLTVESRREQRLRTIEQRLSRMMELDPSPLTHPRTPQERQVGVCRDFAIFLTTFLRHKRIPARMRVGFAEYLNPETSFKIDHWITEYWDSEQERWLLVDPDVGKFDLRPHVDFYPAGTAWTLAA